jgi:hypothetical protein
MAGTYRLQFAIKLLRFAINDELFFGHYEELQIVPSRGVEGALARCNQISPPRLIARMAAERIATVPRRAFIPG